MRRHELTECEWEAVRLYTLGQPGMAGVKGVGNRLFFNAVVWRMRTGVPWRDLPERFGK